MQGLGAGYSPIAPGTCGTLLAIPLYVVLSDCPFELYVGMVLLLFAVGVYGCHLASVQLGVPDHSSLVWDEVVGFLVTMAFLPPRWTLILAGFVLFRLLDIVKPWPASWVDKNMKGGWGVMLDDVLAGIYANLILQFFLWRHLL